MGLQSQINHVSSDSVPLMLLALIAGCVNHLRSFLLRLLHRGSRHLDDGGLTSPSAVGAGLAHLIVLAEQLSINRLLSYRYQSCSAGTGSECVVCLCSLKDGDQVRRLDCCHVFHKDCFDGWLDHFNFNCPLCRYPLVADERVKVTERYVAGDLISWFSLQ